MVWSPAVMTMLAVSTRSVDDSECQWSVAAELVTALVLRTWPTLGTAFGQVNDHDADIAGAVIVI